MQKEDYYKKAIGFNQNRGFKCLFGAKKATYLEFGLLTNYRKKLEKKSHEVFSSLDKREFRAVSSSRELINKLNK